MKAQQLPLFPLNTVLFPGVPIFLHIFEPRYRKMINLCIDERTPFGVVLLEERGNSDEISVPSDIGCSAEIVQVERLENGSLNIVAVGQDRFRVISTNSVEPYLQGEVEMIPMERSGNKQQLEQITDSLQELVPLYIETLSHIGEFEVQWDDLPDDPVEFAYLAAYILQIGTKKKQQFLNNHEALTTLRTIESTYRHEISILQALVDQQRLNPVETNTIFSLN